LTPHPILFGSIIAQHVSGNKAAGELSGDALDQPLSGQKKIAFQVQKPEHERSNKRPRLERDGGFL
jgi:hypothetical protein